MTQQKPIDAKVQISKNGPYIVSGDIPLNKEIISTNDDDESVKWTQGQKYPSQGQYALCRCGRSGNKPFCDGSHMKTGFDGTETASRQPYLEQAKVIRGPTMSLTDVENLCAFARFCDPHGQVWNLVGETDNPSASKHFVSQTCDCPSGRLVAWDNETGKPIEPKYEQSIGLIEDPVKGCSGPVWLRGGVQLIGADGFEYEVRNRVTLCRCGASQNKPFCDGTHASIGFSDEN
ncbi:CDGSH iron-sulfur domain-containing protein [Glaciimonas sp. PCH181]|uniref:CDGSH iron-sulfur domain-containing protein n=1 Tax=Glaciimonas sp. PCH181 TaxID=2133943 RepID=UPI000D39AED0|nr:CDGSH iron-sulfur domain-containing protein [Glaciimonas sp. PCH181]PUA19852.1 iron-binding protein [Glaciimonas sp. PCH181]